MSNLFGINQLALGSNTIAVNQNGYIDVGCNLYAENFIGLNVNCSNVLANSANITNLSVPGSLNAVLDTNSVQIGTNLAQFVNIGTSTLTQTINIGTGSGATTINIGGAGDTVNIAGTLTTVNTTNTTVSDNRITLNKGGAAASGAGAGFTIEEDEFQAGEVMVTDDRAGWKLKAPASAGRIQLYPGAAGFDISASNMWTAQSSNVVRATGGVAIGKGAAEYPLDVIGDARIAGTANIIGDINFTGQLRSNGAPYTLTSSQFSTNGPNVFLAAGSNLAIGKSNAAYTLDVVGDVNVTGAFKVNGATLSSNARVPSEVVSTFYWTSVVSGTNTVLKPTSSATVTYNYSYDGTTPLDVSTGYFTCPVTGVYSVSANFQANLNSASAGAKLYILPVNGSETLVTNAAWHTNTNTPAAGTYNVRANAGDKLYLRKDAAFGDLYHGSFCFVSFALLTGGGSGGSNATGADNYVYKNVTTSLVYPIPANNTDVVIPEFSMTITPTSASAEIELHYMINCEMSTDSVFQLYRNGVKIANHTNNGQIYSGSAPMPYDTNADSTMANVNIRYVDSPNSTAPVTYTIAARMASTGVATTLYVNRTVGSAGAAGSSSVSSYENTVSHAFARQLGGAITVSQAFQSSNNLVFLPSGSNLAIGKSNAAFALDVVGDVNVSGNFKVNGSNLSVVGTGNALGPAPQLYQAISTSKQGPFYPGTTWTDVPNLAITLTPKNANSKCLVRANVTYSMGGTGPTTVAFRFVRNGTAIGVGTDGSYQSSFRSAPDNVNFAAWAWTVGGEVLDAPGSAAACTYKVQYLTYHTSIPIYFNNSAGGSGADNTSSISALTVEEIPDSYGSYFGGNSNVVYLPADSNLAIGKSNAAYALDVVGDVNVSGNFKVNGSNLSLASGGSGSAIVCQALWYTTSDVPAGNYIGLATHGATLVQHNSTTGVLPLNTTTGQFVCRYSGVYQCNITTTNVTQPSQLNIYLHKNGTAVSPGALAYGTVNNSLAMSHAVYCEVGDTLGFYVQTGTAQKGTSGQTQACSISLVGGNVSGGNATGADNYVYKNVTVPTSYPITNAGTTMDVFTMTITPTSVNAEIELSYMIHVESDNNENIVLQLFRNGTRIASPGSNIWQGTVALPFDMDNSTTLGQVNIKYVDAPSTTGSVTYTLVAKTSSLNSSRTLYINRTVSGTDAGEADRERVVSHAFARQLGGSVTVAQANLDAGTVAGGSTSGTVTFRKAFAAPPSVIAQINNNALTTMVTIEVYNVTTTSFQYQKLYVNGGSVGQATGESFNWIAIDSTAQGLNGVSSQFINTGTNAYLPDGSNLGIGTSTPNYSLAIQRTATTNAGTLFVNAALNGSGYGVLIDGTTRNQVTDANVGLLTVKAGGTGATALTTTVAGNVGIGTSAPSNRLHVKDSVSGSGLKLAVENTATASGSHAILEARTTSATGGNPFVQLDVSSVGGWTIGVDRADGNKLKFDQGAPPSVGGNTYMCADTSGNVAFGTATTTASRHTIYGGLGSLLRLWTSTDSGQAIDFKAVQNSTGNGCLTFDTGSSSSGWQKMAFMNGMVGIGTTSPAYPLDVVGNVSSGNIASTYFNYSSGATLFSGTPAHGISIRANNGIWSQQSIISSSDSRIKTNIQDMDDGECLEQLRQIQNKKYEYIDKVSRGNEIVRGFIAQQVEEVMPFAVKTQSDFIPSMFCMADVAQHEDGVRVALRNKQLPADLATGAEVRLYDADNKERVVTVRAIIDANTFSIEEPLSASETFVYGHKVNDFKTLNKDAIFTVAVGAVQELDRKVQAQKAQLDAQTAKIQALTAFLQEKYPNELIAA